MNINRMHMKFGSAKEIQWLKRGFIVSQHPLGSGDISDAPENPRQQSSALAQLGLAVAPLGH
jgi:hypothetical protein